MITRIAFMNKSNALNAVDNLE